MQAFEHCPLHNRKKGESRNGQCPYFHDTVLLHCFPHCDLSSPLKCGDCAHWVGHCASGDSRHKLYGSCFYCVGTVGSKYKTNCKHYTERKPGEPNHFDWVEARVIELGGKPDSSPESRKLRIQARKEWADAHN